MNIFKLYKDKIINILKSANKENLIKLPENLNSINVDLPPSKFNCDISTNVAMVLSKSNEKSPIVLAEILSKLIKQNDHYINDISIEKPGFINIRLNKDFWNFFLKNIINDKSYGSQKSLNQKKYLVEFVSANPTGPLHVGHSRGAILGDVISNLLKFNNHIVTKEYYVNDYGNQILHFTKSVYLRIREILNKEAFPSGNADLNNDTEVNIDDLLVLIGVWGKCDACPSDMNADGFVNVEDILLLISAWGPCE